MKCGAAAASRCGEMNGPITGGGLFASLGANVCSWSAHGTLHMHVET